MMMDQDISKLVAVCASRRRRDSKYKFERRQIPLEIDDSLTMVLEFADTCAGCERVGAKQKDRERFVQKFGALSKDDVARALIVTKKEVFNLMSQIVPCVGCRKSVERLFCQLVESGHPALEPLIITKKAELSINDNFLYDAKAIFALFHVHGSKLNTVMDSIPKSRKNKRCLLHSLDTHKVRGLGIWKDVWDKLSADCREEVVLIDASSLMETLETYLRKHRFCSDCKSKVLRAYNILIGDVDYTTEKGYCPALYEGLKCCPQEKHLHVHCDTEFISQLICRAEPELNGSRRERHAKTLDIAQEEVLTCLGIHLYERLHKIWQKLRAEEQTWQILFYLSVEALKKSFEVAVERNQGISNLELMCEELLEEERLKKQKMEQKRQKKKKKKNKTGGPEVATEMEKALDTCECDENTNSSSTGCATCNGAQHRRPLALDPQSVVGPACSECSSALERPISGRTLACNRSDAGYSSGVDGCESCSMPSSNGSDIVCSEESCTHDHEGESSPCSVVLPDNCKACLRDTGGDCSRKKHNHCGNSKAEHSPSAEPLPASYGDQSYISLQDMLEASCSSDEENEAISEEDIQRFRDNRKLLDSKRQELRQTLRKRFDMLCHNGRQCTGPCTCATRKDDASP